MLVCFFFVFFYGSVAHRYLHVLTHSFPPRRSSDRNERGGTESVTIDTSTPSARPAAVPNSQLSRLSGSIESHIFTARSPFSFDGAYCPVSPIRSPAAVAAAVGMRSEEHTSELQSLMRIAYAVFCLKKKNKQAKQQ